MGVGEEGLFLTLGVGVWTWLSFCCRSRILFITCHIITKLALIVHLDPQTMKRTTTPKEACEFCAGIILCKPFSVLCEPFSLRVKRFIKFHSEHFSFINSLKMAPEFKTSRNCL